MHGTTRECFGQKCKKRLKPWWLSGCRPLGSKSVSPSASAALKIGPTRRPTSGQRGSGQSGGLDKLANERHRIRGCPTRSALVPSTRPPHNLSPPASETRPKHGSLGRMDRRDYNTCIRNNRPHHPTVVGGASVCVAHLTPRRQWTCAGPHKVGLPKGSHRNGVAVRLAKQGIANRHTGQRAPAIAGLVAGATDSPARHSLARVSNVQRPLQRSFCVM